MKGEQLNKQSLPTMKVMYSRLSSKQIKISLVIILVIVLSFIWFLNFHSDVVFVNKGELAEQNLKSGKHVIKFSNDVLKYEDFRRLCYRNTDPKSIEDLNVYVTMLKKRRHLMCQHQYKLFKYVYQVRLKYTAIKISEPFLVKVKKWLHDDPKLIKAMINQSIIFVDNMYSSESVVFNTVRANRPGLGAGNTMDYIKDLIKTTSINCDFCSYANNTASDTFGRMESTHAVIISNAFKIEKYHGLAILKSHNPLYFTQLQFIDCMALAMKYFRRVHKLTPDHLYRIMYWDILPKAGTSQTHPHIHLMLGDNAYYAKWNQLHKSGMLFSREHGSLNYWSVLLQIHTSLGLTVRFGKASLITYLTPQKDFEVLVISAKPCLDFFRLVFFTIRAFVDDLDQYAVSMGFVFPKLNSDLNYGDELPMLFRIVSRGPADQLRSDMYSFDLFGTANVNEDPFKLIIKLKDSVARSKVEKFEYPQWVE